MTDPIDREMNSMCGEVFDHMADEYEYNREDPMAAARGIFNAFLFTLCAGLLFFCGAVIVRGFQ